MDNFAKKLEDIFTQSIAICFPLMSDTKAIIRPSSHADYQCNSAMAISQGLKKKGESCDPRSIADQLVKRLPQNDIVHEAQITGGFINIHLKQDFVNSKVLQLLKEGIHVACDRQERVLVDYSSPNIAKEMHVGHLRSTIIGDCIANVLEFLGHEVIRINHLGDWGTQFGMLLAYLTEKYPDYLDKPPAIGDLQKFYQEAKKRFDEDAEFNKKAKECVVKLQSKDPKFYKAWQMICDISRKEFEVIYEMLDIKGLKEMGESSYQDMMVEVVNDVKEKKLVTEDEGRLIMWPDSASIPLTLVKSDGGFTYDTSDLACIKYRIQEQKAKRIIYVTDSGQESHIKGIKSAAILAGYLQPDQVNVQFVGFGVVTGPGGKKFKTRSGDTVRLKELLDEGLERAGAKLREKERDKEMTEEELAIAQKAIAMGCIKYSDLAHERVKNYEFSFDRMLDDRGNTAVYLLYSLARINSIIRKANLDQSVETIAQQTQRLNLSHIRELRLAKAILKFPEIILQVADTLMPHYLCGYLFDLSVIFSEFYEQCYCIEKVRGSGDEEVFRVNYDRILLCEATARILSKGLQLLGIKLVEKL